MADHNGRFNSWQTSMATNERQSIILEPRVKHEVQRVTFSGQPGSVRLFFHGATSDPVDLSDDEEVRKFSAC